jgi:hypothetical protein
MPKAKAPELIRFGENVRKHHEERDWTHEQLAEKADLVTLIGRYPLEYDVAVELQILKRFWMNCAQL